MTLHQMASSHNVQSTSREQRLPLGQLVSAVVPGAGNSSWTSCGPNGQCASHDKENDAMGGNSSKSVGLCISRTSIISSADGVLSDENCVRPECIGSGAVTMSSTTNASTVSSGGTIGLGHGIVRVPSAASRGQDTIGDRVADSYLLASGIVSGEDVCEQPQLETLRRRFALLRGALRRSNASQAELQSLLERTLDECDRVREREDGLRDAEADARRQCDELKAAQCELRRQCEQLRSSDVTWREQCEQVNVEQTDLKREIGRLRTSEAELRLQCDKVRASEAELRCECDQLRCSDATRRQQCEQLSCEQADFKQEVERIRTSEAELRLQYERIRSSEAELRRQCEQLRSSDTTRRQQCEQLNAEQDEFKQEVERLCTSEAELRLQYENVRASEAELRRQGEQLRSSDAHWRSQCEQLSAEQADVKREVERLRTSDEEQRLQCEKVRSSEAEMRRARDHNHQKWSTLKDEHEGLLRSVQHSQSAEKNARLSERAALAEATSWRRWLASFLDILLRRGAVGLRHGDVTTSQSLEARQPTVHSLIAGIVESTDGTALQPELLKKLPALFEHVSMLISSGGLAVRWGSDLEDERRLRESASLVDQSTERVAQLERQLQHRELAVAALEHDRRALQGELRHLQNVVQELRGSIRVFCRVRPSRPGSTGPLAAAGIGCKVEGSQRLILRKPPGDKKQDFLFDRVFPPEAAQTHIYEEVAPLLPGVLDGLHLCIFAYGQTGAGKTYTLSGASGLGGSGFGSESYGIQDLAIGELLRLANVRSQERADGDVPPFDFWLSALEIYNEALQDLLLEPCATGAATSASLEIRQSRDNLGGVDLDASSGSVSALGQDNLPSPFGSMRVPGLKMWRIQSQDDIEPALKLVATNRHFAATAMNGRSSRSHCIISLSLVQRGIGSARSGDVCTSGVLHIVDLAGSERTKVSQAEGLQMKEANAINKSLSALSDVLYSLGEDSPHVPYRNSKLTYLLQEALGGIGCKTLLFAQVSPEPTDVQETYSTLTFASKVASNVQKGRLRPSALTHSSGGLTTVGAINVSTISQASRSSRQITPPKGCASSRWTPTKGRDLLAKNGPRISPVPGGSSPQKSFGGLGRESPTSHASDTLGDISSVFTASPVPPLPRLGCERSASCGRLR